MASGDVATELTRHLIVPVVVLDNPDAAAPLARALQAGGLPVAEITLRTPAGLSAIRQIASTPGLLVGAGSVLSVEQVDAAAAAGARFAVSPGLSRSVVERCREVGMVALPGAVTATEVQVALELGLDTLKFFPASIAGGPAAIKALGGPFGQVKFVPTGGIGPANLGAYLALPNVAAVGGSWMVPRDAIRDGDWGRITELTADAVAAAQAAGKDN
ncbi:MAG: bifunctional 4-hydroxy-2-oxoglutarate aldolase/2-dehydro-3-deoxy-phosphogluconate aldolase [Bifidobacteriaceae bacterium]|jgi:2-dehydro-3-deoxyphosphogluconate aldolase/(4S)-4-hydroxy-2-oxoglutarate aldolase|nr:bifunctional 4-hydroxy-2-oxoglutarate aldolase/2-dehydro-3-deoxy-phosphogluconate aldolase [Bifidobacteriaceae bacterium]